MRRSIAVTALILFVAAIAAEASAGDYHRRPLRRGHGLGNIYNHAGSPTCRNTFSANTGALRTGESYLCQSPRLTCESSFQLTSIRKSSSGQVNAYDCTRNNPNQEVDGFSCGGPFEVFQVPMQRPGGIARYTCNRKLEDSRTTACGGGWSPTAEEYSQGIRGGGSDRSVYDLQPTNLFYNCVPPNLPAPSPIH